MDIFYEVVCGAISVGLLALIAFPTVVIPPRKPKTEHVGASRWGYYEGLEVPEEEATIEVQPALKKQVIVAGSSMYASGRGINMRG